MYEVDLSISIFHRIHSNDVNYKIYLERDFFSFEFDGVVACETISKLRG